MKKCEINPSLWKELINDYLFGKEYTQKNRNFSQSCPDSEETKPLYLRR